MKKNFDLYSSFFSLPFFKTKAAINPPIIAAAKPTVVNCQTLVEGKAIGSGEIWGVGVGWGVGEVKTWVGWEVEVAVGETVAFGGRIIVVNGLGLKIGPGVGVEVGVERIIGVISRGGTNAQTS